MKTDNLPLEIIEWEDHYGWNHWGDIDSRLADLSNRKGGLLCRTVGWNLYEDEVVVALMAQEAASDTCDHVQVILKGCITERWELSFGKGEGKNGLEDR